MRMTQGPVTRLDVIEAIVAARPRGMGSLDMNKIRETLEPRIKQWGIDTDASHELEHPKALMHVP
jgi:hypothetical protein